MCKISGPPLLSHLGWGSADILYICTFWYVLVLGAMQQPRVDDLRRGSRHFCLFLPLSEAVEGRPEPQLNNYQVLCVRSLDPTIKPSRVGVSRYLIHMYVCRVLVTGRNATASSEHFYEGQSTFWGFLPLFEAVEGRPADPETTIAQRICVRSLDPHY